MKLKALQLMELNATGGPQNMIVTDDLVPEMYARLVFCSLVPTFRSSDLPMIDLSPLNVSVFVVSLNQPIPVLAFKPNLKLKHKESHQVTDQHMYRYVQSHLPDKSPTAHCIPSHGILTLSGL